MDNEKTATQVLLNWLKIITIFFIGHWLIVILPLGPNLSHLPGNLGDTRFNNYILEHDFRWITGQEASLWDAPFSYPYPQTLTFSDNHIGSMLFYSSFRLLGLARESAFQAWYLLSYFLNFCAAVYVLKKMNLNSLAVGIGAFLFTFGLPVLARAGHAQFSYRFCIPLASYALWQFSQKPQLKQLVLMMFLTVWQFYLSIYLGYFLSLLLVVLAIGLLFFDPNRSIMNMLRYWPDLIKLAWKNLNIRNRIFYLFLIASLVLALLLLFQPYVEASKAYGFSRPWQEVSQMLPRIQSYLISDGSKLWHPFSNLFTNITSFRWEHQLFIGISAMVWLFLGLIWRFQSPHKKMAFLFIGAACFLILLTLNIRDFSLYKILYNFPGVNSIRAMTRIILVLLWPIALFIAVEVDALLRVSFKSFNFSIITLLLFGLMVAESVFYNHDTLSKVDAISRIQTIRDQLPSDLPDDPILFVWNPDDISWYLAELDAMMLAQELGWPTINGYSGNLPEGYGPTKDCDQAAVRVISYMDYKKINDPSFYDDFISRIVSMGPEECHWPKEIPVLSVSHFSGPFPDELFSGISIKILSIAQEGDNLYIQIDVENHSLQTLPAESSSGNAFRLSWRMIDASQDKPISEFDNRKDLISDIPTGGHAVMTIITSPPKEKGEYFVEVSAVQENIAWFHDKGMLPARSMQTIRRVDDDSSQWSISN